LLLLSVANAGPVLIPAPPSFTLSCLLPFAVVTREEFENDVEHLDDEQRRVAPVFTADDALPTADETARKAQADAKKVEAKAKEAKDTAEEKAKEGAAQAKQTADAAADKAKQAAGTVEAKAKETKDAAASKAEDVKEKAKQTAANVEAEAKKDYSAAKSEVKKGAAKTEQAAEQAADNAVETSKFEYDALSTQAKAAYNKMSKEVRMASARALNIRTQKAETSICRLVRTGTSFQRNPRSAGKKPRTAKQPKSSRSQKYGALFSESQTWLSLEVLRMLHSRTGTSQDGIDEWCLLPSSDCQRGCAYEIPLQKHKTRKLMHACACSVFYAHSGLQGYAEMIALR
jgi:hypothetical protein